MTRTLDDRTLRLRLMLAGAAAPAGATSRIKDLANIEGVRQNQLIGYGLVVGLNGTGDTLNNIPFTSSRCRRCWSGSASTSAAQQIRTGNVAAVMVTANLPAFGTQGTRIDVTVSALGDAKSLQGGTLLVTPLLGADGNVYAVAQGSLAIGGFQAEGDAAKIVRGVPTVGRISNGAIIEREIEFALNRLGAGAARAAQCRLHHRQAHRRPRSTISSARRPPSRSIPSTVQLTIPKKFQGNVVALLTEIEQLQVEPDLAAKVVIDERSGIIVMGRDVRVSTVAVAQGNLTVTISETPQVSQPQPFSRGADRGRAAHPHRRAGGRQEARGGARRRVAAAAGRRPQRARHRPARPDLDPAGDQGRRRDPGRHRGDVMSASHQPSHPPRSHAARVAALAAPPRIGRRRRQGQGARQRGRFRGVFLNTMFSQMFTGIDGDGPFGGGGAAGVWRSFLTDEYAKSFAKAGGIGIADHVYRALLAQQEARRYVQQRTRTMTHASLADDAIARAGRRRGRSARRWRRTMSRSWIRCSASSSRRPSWCARAGCAQAAKLAQAEDRPRAALYRRHAAAARQPARNSPALAPDTLAALMRRHDTFRALLQINLTVLATAHAVSEGIVRGVSGEMARKAVAADLWRDRPRQRAGPARGPAAGGQPLALSRPASARPTIPA